MMLGIDATSSFGCPHVLAGQTTKVFYLTAPLPPRSVATPVTQRQMGSRGCGIPRVWAQRAGGTMFLESESEFETQEEKNGPGRGSGRMKRTQRHNTMKTKAAQQPRKTTVQLKDLKPKKNPKAGALIPYVSKVTGEKQYDNRTGT
jgi:hypothetical protein